MNYNLNSYNIKHGLKQYKICTRFFRHIIYIKYIIKVTFNFHKKNNLLKINVHLLVKQFDF